MTLEILTSDLLTGTQHGFFTRKGGASSGIFNGLNCGFGSSDQREIVAINRARVAQAMNVAPDHLVTIHQTHSPDVAVITDPAQDAGPADAMVTNVPGIALGILTADCQPVLFADARAGVVGAAHAGWRGALDGVLDRTLDAMVALGADRSHIKAAIGPTISQRAYEVGPEFFDSFTGADIYNARFFVAGQGDRKMFDLPSYGLHRMHAAGIGDAEWTRHCTYTDPDRFFSYRRTTHVGEADYGRLISVIRL
ncbi:peptidoglycan editing factor PgeF [Thalassovita sp.]|uniref:peptidoglycan editing factor PgeF n=1 Tax=Thalassovita sp. TaxID=1979401 RepID=UPI0029DE673B|nr:peptidoglycan editing factor PgeF [Thalassovita sp.]